MNLNVLYVLPFI